MSNKVNMLAQRGIHRSSSVGADLSSHDFDDPGPVFVSAASAMRKIRTMAAPMAKTDLPVLLVGESNTDKDAIARLIHKVSPRAQHVFAWLDCSSLTDDVLELELFDFESPAPFNGGRPKRGILELCNRGTILLENFTEMPSRLQARLLDLLDAGFLYRTGGQERIRVDVRILASTPLDIDQALAIGKLRTDLYFRLNTLTLEFPLGREPNEEAWALVRNQWNFEDFVRRSLLTGNEVLPLSNVYGKGGKAGGGPDPPRYAT